MIEKYKTKHRH